LIVRIVLTSLPAVILTRLSRVTFHTAHKYLGLTKEVMRTEKHINELACFTLPAAFYEQGGMERLRQRFLPEPNKNARPSKEGSFGAAAADIDDYFRDAKVSRHASSSSRGGMSADTSPELRRKGGREGSGATARPAKTPWGHPDAPLRTPTSRTSVGPGDLFSMTGTDEMGRPSSPLSYLVATPRPRRGTKVDDLGTIAQGRLSTSSERIANFGGRSTEALVSPQGRGSEGAGSESDAASFAGFGTGVLANFDLKDAVMSCIARSIGLAQAPASDSPVASMSASPFINPADAVLQRGVFKSAFSSLSMLDAAMSYEDESSVTGASSAFGVQHADLENEVEVRFFPAGSTLARAGENAAGLFYVIDGFLDVIVPPDVDQKLAEKEFERPAGPKPKAPARHPSTSRPANARSGTIRPESTRRTSPTTTKPPAARASARPSSMGGAPSSSSRIGNALDGTHAGAVPRPANRSRPTGGKTPGPAPAAVPLQHAGPDFGLPENRKEGPRAIYSVGRGGIAGYLSSLLGAPSYVDVVAKTDTYVGVLPAKALERVMERRPIVLLTLCKRLLSLLSPLSAYDAALALTLRSHPCSPANRLGTRVGVGQRRPGHLSRRRPV
jgi:lysophospholipid hydrolase